MSWNFYSFLSILHLNWILVVLSQEKLYQSSGEFYLSSVRCLLCAEGHWQQFVPALCGLPHYFVRFAGRENLSKREILFFAAFTGIMPENRGMEQIV